MSERVSDIVTTPCGLTMPKRCANCPAIARAQEILSEEQDRLHDLGVQALKGIDPNMLSVDVQQEDGSVASVPLSKVLEQYPDEEVAKGLNHANKEVRKSVAEQMDRLEEVTKGAQENIAKATAHCPGSITARFAARGTEFTITLCGRPAPHNSSLDEPVLVRRRELP